MNIRLCIKTLAVATTFCLLPLTSATAQQLKHKVKALSASDAAALGGKTVAVTLQKRQSFVAMTAGKVQFGLLGAAAMVKVGNDFVEENAIPDPSIVIREQLAAALHNGFGAHVLAADTEVTEAKKPAALAKRHPEADYVLAVQHTGSSYSYYPVSWGEYWVNNSVLVQLVDTKTGRLVSKGTCYASTFTHPVRLTRDQLHANGAQLTKDVLTSLSWTCAQALAREQFKLPEDKIPTIPVEHIDPLARLQPNGATPAPATAAATTTEAVVEPAATPEPAPAPEAVVESAAEPEPATP